MFKTRIQNISFTYPANVYVNVPNQHYLQSSFTKATVSQSELLQEYSLSEITWEINLMTLVPSIPV